MGPWIGGISPPPHPPETGDAFGVTETAQCNFISRKKEKTRLTFWLSLRLHYTVLNRNAQAGLCLIRSLRQHSL